MRGDEDQPRRTGKRATGVTYVDTSGDGMGAAGRAGDPLRLPAVQRAAADAVGDRQALRPADRRGPDRPQFHAIRRCRPRSASSTRPSSTSIRSSRPARSACASTSSTATISTTARSASSAAAISGQVQTNGRPIETHAAAARHAGLGRRNGSRRCATIISARVYAGAGVHGSCYSYRDNYLDLDPTYKDRFGRPLLRMTMDFHDNEIKMSALSHRPIRRDRQAMGAKQVVKQPRKGPYDITEVPDLASLRRRHHGRRSRATARSTDICRAGTCRTCSCRARRPFRRTPATTRPARSARSPIWSAEAIRSQYLKNPGPLVHA